MASRYAPDTSEPADTWRDNALCRKAKRPDVMYPPVTDAIRTRTAKQWCARCPVVAACRQWALERHEQHGVWGGLSETERRVMYRNQTREGAAA